MHRSFVIAVAACAAAHGLLASLAVFQGSLSAGAAVILGLGSIFATAAWLGCAHELAHFGVARAVGASGLTMRLPRFAVSYDTPDTPWKSMLISLAGPATGVVYGACCLWLGNHANIGPYASGWLVVISLVSCAQLLFMLPFAGDGSVFWQSLRQQIRRKS